MKKDIFNEQKLFELFIENCNNNYSLYERIKEFLEYEIKKAKGVENTKAYNFLTDLINNENNAGWEDRHSERIDWINAEMGRIANEYGYYFS